MGFWEGLGKSTQGLVPSYLEERRRKARQKKQDIAEILGLSRGFAPGSDARTRALSGLDPDTMKGYPGLQGVLGGLLGEKPSGEEVRAGEKHGAWQEEEERKKRRDEYAALTDDEFYDRFGTGNTDPEVAADRKRRQAGKAYWDADRARKGEAAERRAEETQRGAARTRQISEVDKTKATEAATAAAALAEERAAQGEIRAEQGEIRAGERHKERPRPSSTSEAEIARMNPTEAFRRYVEMMDYIQETLVLEKDEEEVSAINRARFEERDAEWGAQAAALKKRANATEQPPILDDYQKMPDEELLQKMDR
jgi:hypothetical protein